MLFSEVYGSYFNAVAKILELATAGDLEDRDINSIVREKSFGDSVQAIPHALFSGKWPLLSKNLTTPLKNPPSMPLTTLQKRWLKTLLQDPRIGLFAPSMEGLEDVEPLFSLDAFVYYDRYLDGDPFRDSEYVAHFRSMLLAVREKRRIHVCFVDPWGREHCRTCAPMRLVYSSRDDKFRLEAYAKGHLQLINLGRVKTCEVRGAYTEEDLVCEKTEALKLVLELKDERNTLERAMLHFSHLAKETEDLGNGRYRVQLICRQDDEPEMIIRVLAFGPTVKVVEPAGFVEKLKERMRKQMALEQG